MAVEHPPTDTNGRCTSMALYREPRPQGCSFCGRDAEHTRGIVAGDGVGICDECVGLALDVLNERGVGLLARRPVGDRSARDRSIGWLTPVQDVDAGEEVVMIDLTAEVEMDVDPDVVREVRWPP